MNPYEIIKTVRLTEKAVRLGEKNNQYIFIVDRRATKPEIRRAVETLFNVKVIDVQTLNMPSKVKRRLTAHPGHTQELKKAIVTLKEGDKIVLT
jgi:large subunit ribosomal protein L23